MFYTLYVREGFCFITFSIHTFQNVKKLQAAPSGMELTPERHLVHNGSPLLPTPPPAAPAFGVDPHMMPMVSLVSPPGFEAQQHMGVQKPISAPPSPFVGGAIPKVTANASSLSSLSPITTSGNITNSYLSYMLRNEEDTFFIHFIVHRYIYKL